MTGGRRAGGAALALGLGVVILATFAARVPPPPLYDGVVPVEAYRWLDPPPGEHGGAAGATIQIPVTGATSPLVVLATGELTPQAQIFAAPGALTLPSGTTSLTVTIEPVRSSTTPAVGHIAGNVYRITVVTQAGAAVTSPAGSNVTISLRAPDPTTPEATMALLAAGTWQPVDTEPSGLGGSFLGLVTTFGDFALVVAGPAPTPGGSVPGTVPPGSAVATAGPTPTADAGGGAIAPITIFAVLGFAVVVGGLLLGAVLPGRRRPSRNRRPPPGR